MEILEIVEHKFLVEQMFDPDESRKLNWDFTFEFDVPDDKSFLSIRVGVTSSLLDRSEDGIVLELIISHVFRVEDIDRFVYSESNQEFDDETRLYLASLLGISLSGIRGIIFAKSSSTYLGRLLLPIVSPIEFAKEITPFPVTHEVKPELKNGKDDSVVEAVEKLIGDE